MANNIMVVRADPIELDTAQSNVAYREKSYKVLNVQTGLRVRGHGVLSDVHARAVDCTHETIVVVCRFL